MINVTYAITVCTELAEITRLINFLLPKLESDDEILVQYDTENTPTSVRQYLNIISSLHTNKIRIIDFPLNGDFSSFKNNLKQHSNGIFILQLDADELPAEYFIDSIHDILGDNKDVDLFYIPRINTVDGITLSHTHKWGWNITKFDNIVDEKILDTDDDEYQLLKHYDLIISEDGNKVKFHKPIVNFPDYQSRLYRRASSIVWENKVHEVINGFRSMTVIPPEPDYCIYHPKNIVRQELQNQLYDTIQK